MNLYSAKYIKWPFVLGSTVFDLIGVLIAAFSFGLLIFVFSAGLLLGILSPFPSGLFRASFFAWLCFMGCCFQWAFDRAWVSVYGHETRRSGGPRSDNKERH